MLQCFFRLVNLMCFIYTNIDFILLCKNDFFFNLIDSTADSIAKKVKEDKVYKIIYITSLIVIGGIIIYLYYKWGGGGTPPPPPPPSDVPRPTISIEEAYKSDPLYRSDYDAKMDAILEYYTDTLLRESKREKL